MKTKTLKKTKTSKTQFQIRWALPVALCMATMLFAGCAKAEQGESAVQEQEQVQAPAEMKEEASVKPAETAAPEQDGERTLVDREGNTLTLPAQVNSIISMAPSTTETLIHLGLADKLVAVDLYSAEIEGIPEGIPTFDIMTPDTESIAAIKPDIIIATGMSKSGGDDPFAPVTSLGVVMTYIPSPADIAGIKEDIRFLGSLTGTEDKAEEVVAAMEKEIDEVLAKITIPEVKQKVLFEVAAAPDIYSFGSGTFLNEMLELLGAENILADQEGWLSVSEESILSLNPDVIFTNVNYIEDPAKEILDRSSWTSVKAVQDKRVFQVDTNASSRPNEYIAAAFLQLAKGLYPEAFS